jgi:hypothetical protein
MMRRPLAVVLVTCGLLAPAAASGAAAAPASAAPAASALPRVAPAPDAPTVDRCATRAKQVTRLKRRLRAAETKRGKARTRRLLNASRRSLKRCRAHVPAPKPPTPPVPLPAPGPTPSPSPGPPPVAIPEPGQPAIIVNGGANGVFAPTTALQLQATDLPPLPDGSVYHFAVRAPVIPRPPAGGWQGCHRSNVEDVTFDGPTGSATMVPQPAWCTGPARAFVWVGPPTAEYMGTNQDVAAVSFTITSDAVATAG